MKRYLPFSELRYLRPILPQDHEFAVRVAHKYNIPENELCWAVRDIRDNLEDTELYEELDTSFNKKYHKKLAAINLDKNDPLFKTFNKHFKKISIDIKTQKDKDKKFINGILNQSVFFKLVLYFRQFNETDLNKYNKHIAVGMFLVHFKLWPRDNQPYHTESEYKAAPKTTAETWEEYLYNIVKSRLRPYSSEVSL